MRALPHHFSTFSNSDPQSLVFTIEGEGGGIWLLESKASSWRLIENATANGNNKITIPEDIAWRIFTNGIDRMEAMKKSKISGHQGMARHFFDVIAVMA